jgi:hypothetical protein
MTVHPMINGVDHVRLTTDEYWNLPRWAMQLVEVRGTPLRLVDTETVGFEIDRQLWADITRAVTGAAA